MFEIIPMEKADSVLILPCLFQLLSDNMVKIAPTGNTIEQDRQIWMEAIRPALECQDRQILLIKQSNIIIGFFQYSIDDTFFKMEEIQIAPEYWCSGAFQDLYRYLAQHIPNHIRWVEAYANKQNSKSQGILRHLGLEVIGENKNGNSYHFRGDCQRMLARYR